MPKSSSGASAYDTVIQAIRDGRYKPGDRLVEEEVSEQLAMSRTPVREALRRLEAEQIITHRPRQGAVVRALDHSEVVELYEMRIFFERKAAELAAQHGTQSEFDVLGDLNRAISAERKNSARAAAINQDFHRLLYQAARNRFLVTAARALNNSLLLLGPTTFTDEARVETVTAQHSAIIAALRARDVAAAGEAAETHLKTSLRARLKGMSP